MPSERTVVAHVTLAPTPDVIRLENGRPGGYLESRGWYGGEAFETDDPGERRTVHMAVDVWQPAGEPVRAALDGVVEGSEVRPEHFDFGGTVILRHFTEDGTPFFTLYGHLSHDLPEPGTAVTAGDQIGVLGTQAENGGWEPHLHFQLLTSLVGMGTGVHGVAAPSELDLWESICPDPNLLLRAPTRAADRLRTRDDIRRRRRTNLSRALSISYREPLEIVRGERAYLYDNDGNAWLDLVNNVCHVGHAHPRVTAAMADQAFVLNTNTRYLHPTLVTYARRLAATLPDPLSVVFLTNSGSEANDLALRLARAHTGRRDVLALEWAYHGNLSSLIDISQYKFDRPGGTGRPEHVRLCKVADPYRGTFGDDGPAYADDVLSACAEHDAAAFIIESLPGCAGQIELATGYLQAAFNHARNAGVVCIADEVQVGFGRVGSHFWGFETQGVVPDIVTMGKPIGNGHPLGAVVTTPQIAHSFANGMEYFNTFGGNPVSAAVGLAVLDVIRDERLQARAHVLGARFKAGLRGLMDERPLIGDVRGRGLYLGVELVRDRAHPRAGDRRGRRGQGGRQGPGHPAVDRRALRQRAEDQAAAGDHGRRRRPLGRGHRPRRRRALARRRPRRQRGLRAHRMRAAQHQPPGSPPSRQRAHAHQLPVHTIGRQRGAVDRLVEVRGGHCRVGADERDDAVGRHLGRRRRVGRAAGLDRRRQPGPWQRYHLYPAALEPVRLDPGLGAQRAVGPDRRDASLAAPGPRRAPASRRAPGWARRPPRRSARARPPRPAATPRSAA